MDCCSWLPTSIVGTGRLALCAAVFASAAAPAQTHRPALSGYVSLASDYRLHGLSQTAGGAALQLGIDYQHGSGAFAGGRASNVDFPVDRYGAGGPYGYGAGARRVEADYYAGYDFRRGAWASTVTLTRYAYAGGAGYDYGELAVTLGFADKLYYTAARSDDLYGSGDAALEQTLGSSWPLGRWGLEIGGSLSRLSTDRVPGGSYTHWDLGISKLVGPVNLDLRRYGNDVADTYFGLGDPSGGWVLAVSYGWLTTR